MKQDESIFKRGVNSFKKNGFKKTLYKIFKFIRGIGVLSFSSDIRALWFESKEISNFGDNLTPYLIEKLSGKKPYLVNRYCCKEYYLMAGSILSEANKNSIIFGTGIMIEKEKFKKPKKVLAVRGPLTRKRLIELGYNCPDIYGDPALLLPLVYKPKVAKQYQIGIIPHYVDYDRVKENLEEDNNFFIINILDPIEKVIDDINKCEKTISSSLHGLIVSHAYGIPSLWVKFSDNLAGDDTKFYDYLCSVNIMSEGFLNLQNYKFSLETIKKEFMERREIAEVSRSIIQKLQKNLLNLWPLPIYKRKN